MKRFTDTALDQDTAAALRAGDRTALAALYDALSTPVYTLAYRVLDDANLAEEVTHDTFVDVMTKAKTLKDDRALAGWVRTIAVNHCLMRLRSPWSSRRAPLAELNGEARSNGSATAVDLERALRRLPALTRAVVWLHDVEGYTHAEIAVMFDRTASFSKSQLARGRDALAAAAGTAGGSR